MMEKQQRRLTGTARDDSRVPAPISAAGENDNACRILAKSVALVPEEAVHEALATISDGAAVAFDLGCGADHYFDPDLTPAELTTRLLQGLTDLAPHAPARLQALLAAPLLRQDLSDAFARLTSTVQSVAGPTQTSLRGRRFVIVHQGHVLFDAGMILDHAGTQARSGIGPGRPTIYLPLDLLNHVRDAGSAAQTGLRFLLEHADFHLRGNPGALVIAGHPYSSREEHAQIERLWGKYRPALLNRLRAEMDLQAGPTAAYWATVLYLLGATDLVMAGDVPMVLQRLETTGDDLCPYIPQLFDTFCNALAPDDPAARWKLMLLESVGRGVGAILSDHGVQLEPEVMDKIDRPSAGVLAIRRTLNEAAVLLLAQRLDELKRDGRPQPLERAIELIRRQTGGEDLVRAAEALRELPAPARDTELLAETFLLNRHEARLLDVLASSADRAAAEAPPSARPQPLSQA